MNTTSGHGLSSTEKRRRWTKGVLVCAWIAAAVLAVNIILTIASGILAATIYKGGYNGEWNGGNFARATAYEGKCSTAKTTATVVHLLINILSTIMLGASNYAMQCLAAPSRLEVDEAHEKREWLNIGTPHIPGLIFSSRAGWRRRVLGGTLLLTSFPIHLIYNSAAYYSMQMSQFPVIMASANTPLDKVYPTEDQDAFEQCFAPNINMDMTEFLQTMREKRYQRLSKQDCVDTFAKDFVFGQKTLILITNAALNDRDAPLIFVGRGNTIGFADAQRCSFEWMCPSHLCSEKDVKEKYMANWKLSGSRWALPELNVSVPTENGFENIEELYQYTEDSEHLHGLLSEYLTAEELRQELDDQTQWVNSSWAQNVRVQSRSGHTCANEENVANSPQYAGTQYPIDHCLAVPTEETCQLVFMPIVCLIVICCNAIKLVCILLTARDDRDELLLTIGDAISSFLTRPDPATRGTCLLSKSLAEQGAQGWRKIGNKETYKTDPSHDKDTNQFLPGRKRWAQAVSHGRWMGTLSLCITILVGAGVAFHFASIAYRKTWGAGSIWESGLGEPSTATVLQGLYADFEGPLWATVLKIILLANTPQLIVSFAYYFYNSLLTSMLLAHEYSSYATEKRPLRVSWPSGAQRSTYYLSIPYKYGMTLLVISALLHWLVSQSFFYVEHILFETNGYIRWINVSCGFSPAAIVPAMILGGLLILGGVALGLRPLASRMPLAVHCSAAISAACHPPDSDPDHALKPVQWGEVPEPVSTPPAATLKYAYVTYPTTPDYARIQATIHAVTPLQRHRRAELSMVVSRAGSGF
ncbi:uncharacterized protein BDV17DRAFT_280507 [Aspergillus undulatus]|uniref:uncharacterized protein n=1 Tax=Aspergillus undulatus TaxID=1810928 RepID=UPI003CCE2A97